MDVIDRTAAGALIPETLAAEILQDIQDYSAVMSLGTRAPDMSTKVHRIPVLSALPMTKWVDGDGGLISASAAAWKNKYLEAEKLATVIPVPNDVIDDASWDIWGQLRPLISAAIGRQFDRTVFFGEDAPASFPDDLLTGATAASHTVDLSAKIGAGQDLFDILLGENGVMSLVEEDGFGVTGHVAALVMKSKLRGLRSKVYDGANMVAAGVPLFQRSPDRRDIQSATVWDLEGDPIVLPKNDVFDTAKILSISGDWSKLVWALRKDISYTLLTEGVIQDAAGNIVFNLGQQDMSALRVTFRAAWQLPNPINLANPEEASRYPFAVLVP
jgi:hypothetical protein